MTAFKAYDIRGVYGKDFDRDTVYRIGFFIPRLLNTDHVLVGRDVRLSSPEIHEYLVKGITDSGADVWDLGLCTTPMVYYATRLYKADASVQITASHNPPQYNGLKISRTDALPVGGDTGLKDLERMVVEEPVSPADRKGSVKDCSSFVDRYIEFQKTFVPDLVGQQYQRAVDVLQESSLNVGRLVFDASVKDYADSTAAVVYSQNPGAYVPFVEPVTMRDTLVANSLRRGSSVTLYLTVDRTRIPEKR